VLCGSRATRESLIDHLGVAGDRVRVIPYGVADVFFAGPDARTNREANAGGDPYMLFVGTREARKGLSTLYAALRRVNAEGTRARLVLAGQDGWGTEGLLREMRGDAFVTFVDKPSDDQLTELYHGALALAYPSEMEGFGLPVAEAMACGCPVIASDLPSIREFAGDQPIYIAAGDSESLAREVEQLLNGRGDLDQRRASGRDRVMSLRWSALGALTADVLEEVASEQGARR
jgi:glycosyltransferase involved in cell wall biosynthesis